MQSARSTSLAAIGLALIIGWGPIGAPRAGAQGSELPSCTGWSNCNRGRAVCTFEAYPPYSGPTTVADSPDGLSSDGRGPYISGTDGVGPSFVVLNFVGLGFGDAGGGKNPRTLTVNLNHHVPGGGGVPLGVISVGNDNMLFTSWQRVGNVGKSLVGIPVGQTVSAGQLNVSFHLNGRFHILQMGPQAYGHCHSGADSTRVHGAGTSSGTIYRASPSKWVIDLPAGSVARLFDVSHTAPHAEDKGLYYFRLHYEMDGIASVVAALGPLAETQGAAGVVARYRALKRDSARAYLFDEGGLSSIAYRLLDNKKPQDALIVFRLSVEEYPDASSPYYGMGQAYLALADTSKAIANFRRSLSLNPNNQDAADALKRLGTKR